MTRALAYVAHYKLQLEDFGAERAAPGNINAPS